ncbi:recombinase family protein [Planococcus halocryophilus]|uniref:Resolvase n=1 Tax=Planococcus halocryophilus TaxID=1215089 RepID=A0A1C7DW34_9BACL|nr:recombinase family protein [Planococcus halocryophilus]ANU15423.1 resolvase [Planococcus halocryophilus]
MAVIGYARVSSAGQDLDLQAERLTEYGCDKIYQEKESGANADRKQLQEALEYLREGDTFVVFKLDRLARSITHLNKIAEELTARGITLVFIKEQIDFSTATGKLMFNMLGSFAQFERDLINDRTAEGRERARKQGKHLGRKGQPKEAVQHALKLLANREQNGLSVNAIAKTTGVPRASIYAEAKKLKSD